VSRHRFRDFERVAKVKFPEELMALYSIVDGSSDVCFIPVPNDIEHYFMSSTELIYAWQTQKELLEGGDFDGRPGSGDTAIRTVWWSTKWIPFAENGGGNYLCVDLSPAKGGVKGQIISHNHEGGEHK